MLYSYCFGTTSTVLTWEVLFLGNVIQLGGRKIWLLSFGGGGGGGGRALSN